MKGTSSRQYFAGLHRHVVLCMQRVTLPFSSRHAGATDYVRTHLKPCVRNFLCSVCCLLITQMKCAENTSLWKSLVALSNSEKRRGPLTAQ